MPENLDKPQPQTERSPEADNFKSEVFETPSFDSFQTSQSDSFAKSDNPLELDKTNNLSEENDGSLSERPGKLPLVKFSSGVDVFLPDNALGSQFEPQIVYGDGSAGENQKLSQKDIDQKTLDLFSPNKPDTKERGSDQRKEADVKKDSNLDSNKSKNIEQNAKGQTERITYPDKSSRAFGFDSSENLNQIELTNKEGNKFTYNRKDNGKWYTTMNGIDFPVRGDFNLKPNNDFGIKSEGSKTWQYQKPDGTMYTESERKNSPESKRDAIDVKPRPKPELEKDEHGNTVDVKLPNGSHRNYKFDQEGKELLQITDNVKTSSGDRKEVWTREFDPETNKLTDDFVRTHPAGSREKRSKIEQAEDGAYEYTDAKGDRKTSRLGQTGDSKPETPWKAKIEKDGEGRYKSIDNDRFSRRYEYFEGTNKIKSYTVFDKQLGRGATWSRSSAESKNWTATHPQHGHQIGSMQGEFSVTDDGVHVVDKTSSGTYGFMGNGGKIDITQSKDGSLVGKEGGKVRYVRKKDGSSAAQTSDGQISVYDASTGMRTNWNRGSDGNWNSDNPYEPDTRKDLSFNENLDFSFKDEAGRPKTRTFEGEDMLHLKNGAKLIFDSSGKLSKIKHGDTTKEFERDGEKITGVTETNEAKGENRTTFPPVTKDGQEVDNVKLANDGTFTYDIKNGDGSLESSVRETSDFIKAKTDGDGDLQEASRPNGFTRKFNYVGEGASKKLAQIEDTRKTSKGDKTTTWSRKANPDGSLTDKFYSTTDSGKERTPRTIENVKDDGSYEYKTDDMKPGQDARLQRMSGGDGFFSDSVEDAHLELMERLEQHMDEPRLKRMDEMMKAFEQRMERRAEARKLAGVKSADEIDKDVNKTITNTYANLAKMVDADGDTFYSQDQRTFLAENFMFHAQDPTTSDQGSASNGDWDGHGTCWINSAHIWGMTQRTDHMADLLKQVSTTGKYTTKNGGEKGGGPKTFTFSKRHLGFDNDRKQETGWSISKATDRWDRQPNLIRQCDGDRSPVGKIFDYVLPVLGGRPQRANRMDGGTYGSFQSTNGWYTGSAELLSMVTGDKPCAVNERGHTKGHLIDNSIRKSLLEKGTVMNYLPGHLRSMALKNINGQWAVVQDDQHGEGKDKVIERITDIAAWARGDRSASRRVSEALNHRKYKLETDYTIKGSIKPTPDDRSLNNNSNQGGNSNWNQPRRRHYRRWR